MSCTTEQQAVPSQNGDLGAFEGADTNHDDVVDLEEWDQCPLFESYPFLRVRMSA
jgi:hypothetical protein